MPSCEQPWASTGSGVLCETPAARQSWSNKPLEQQADGDDAGRQAAREAPAAEGTDAGRQAELEAPAAEGTNAGRPAELEAPAAEGTNAGRQAEREAPAAEGSDAGRPAGSAAGAQEELVGDAKQTSQSAVSSRCGACCDAA